MSSSTKTKRRFPSCERGEFSPIELSIPGHRAIFAGGSSRRKLHDATNQTFFSWVVGALALPSLPGSLGSGDFEIVRSRQQQILPIMLGRLSRPSLARAVSRARCCVSRRDVSTLERNGTSLGRADFASNAVAGVAAIATTAIGIATVAIGYGQYASEQVRLAICLLCLVSPRACG